MGPLNRSLIGDESRRRRDRSPKDQKATRRLYDLAEAARYLQEVA